MENNEPILVSLISAVSGIIIAYIVNVAAKRVQQKKQKEGPIDRIEQIFDEYERLIKQKDLEDERKQRLISELENEIDMTREMVKKLAAALDVSQRELQESRRDNQELKDMLHQIREEYHELKKQETGEK